jgi:hypothetical protein
MSRNTSNLLDGINIVELLGGWFGMFGKELRRKEKGARGKGVGCRGKGGKLE